MYNANDYQKQAMRTANPNLDSSQRLLHAVTGLTSEAGECASFIQKIYQGHESPLTDKQKRREFLLELGDVLWMAAEICEACGVTLNDVMQANVMKLQKRYPDGFDAERSKNK
jgi:NTP pyrophosphatase (non-canonical NTP hydrolase)